jgi:hypothetical protein
VAELLARPADGRRVDDRQELLEVLGEKAVEQRRVAVLERCHPDVLLERVLFVVEVLQLELDLLVDGQDAIGQQAAQPKVVPLRVAEREVLRQQPTAEERGSRQRDRCRAAGGDIVVRSGEGTHPGEDSGPSPPSVRGTPRPIAPWRVHRSASRVGLALPTAQSASRVGLALTTAQWASRVGLALTTAQPAFRAIS